jgi:hypothetical protein
LTEILVSLRTWIFVAATPPKVTVSPVTKFVPVMTTVVPPSMVPAFGSIALTVGIGAPTVNGLLVADVRPVLDATK